MIIYVDVLLFVNAVVDYLLICAASAVLRKSMKSKRKIIAAFVSSLFSLCVFLPDLGVIGDIAVRLAASAVTVLVGFGYGNFRSFLRAFSAFFAVTFIYGGAMTAVYAIFSPEKMAVENGVVYYDVSLAALLVLSTVIYVLMVLLKKITARDCELAKRCDVTLKYKSVAVTSSAMVDTGQSVKDLFSDSVVLVVDRPTAVRLFGSAEAEALIGAETSFDVSCTERFRMIPIETVSGTKLLPAVKIDGAVIKDGAKTYRLHKPIAAIGEMTGSRDYSVIIPPEALTL